MNTTRLRFEAMRDLYQTQRDRREHIRDSVATPVAALAFSVFNLSTLASSYDFGNWAHPAGLAIAVIALTSVAALLVAAALIIRIERNFVYLDPPDLHELVDAEQRIRAAGDNSDENASEKMHDLLAGTYDIIYRRYFAGNEHAARDRTWGLRLIMFALGLLAVAFVLLPAQMEAGG